MGSFSKTAAEGTAAAVESSAADANEGEKDGRFRDRLDVVDVVVVVIVVVVPADAVVVFADLAAAGGDDVVLLAAECW